MDLNERKYYVYKWYFKSSGEIFHIGKGTGKRYQERRNHRNQYFRNIIEKYKDDVDSKIMIDNLSSDEALNLERKLIIEYKAIGQCKTNLHEGGCGGYTGNYDSPERSKKISDHAKTRIGIKNSMYGRHHSENAKKRIGAAQLGKRLSKAHLEKLKRANTGRVKTEAELEKLRQHRKGIPMSKEHYIKMMYADSNRYFVVKYKELIIYSTISQKRLKMFAKEKLKISYEILDKLIKGNYIPKFSRNKWLSEIHVNAHELDDSVKNFLASDEIEHYTISDEIVEILNNVQPSHYIKTEKYFQRR